MRFGPEAGAEDVEQVGGTVSISQEIEIDGGMQAATLSYMAKSPNDVWDDNSQFFAKIKDESGIVRPVYSGAIPREWLQVSVDVSQYMGQTVTLIFELVQDEADPPIIIYLDDVSVSSAHPDLYANLQGKAPAATEGEILYYSLSYGNRGAIPAEDSYMTLQLDEDLSLFLADPAPSSQSDNTLRWELGTLEGGSEPGHILVGAEVGATDDDKEALSSTATIGSITRELRSANNTSQAETLIGSWQLLPMIQR